MEIGLVTSLFCSIWSERDPGTTYSLVYTRFPFAGQRRLLARVIHLLYLAFSTLVLLYLSNMNPQWKG